MGCRFTQLQCKEVICVGSGQRLGFIADVEVTVPEGNVVSIIVPGPCRFLGMFGRKNDFCIPWGCVRRIGPDIVLVDTKPEDCCIPRERGKWRL